MVKRYFRWLWSDAHEHNTKNIIRLLEPNPSAKLLDLGCDDGSLTRRFADRVGASNVHGCDSAPGPLTKARRAGIITKQADFNRRLPYRSNSFEIVVSNQVIEHLFDTDRFVEEIFRILKPGGYAVISTENLSSWHNIFALIIGKPAFSQHVSARRHVGNPLSLVAGMALRPGWTHVKIFTLSGLVALLRLYGFRVAARQGAGYYPLPAPFVRAISRLSPGHSAFIAVKARKPEAS